MCLAFDPEGIDWTFHVSADSVSRTPPMGLVNGGVLQDYKERVSRRATRGADNDNNNDSSSRKESGGSDGGVWFAGTGGEIIQLGMPMVLLETRIDRVGKVSERGTGRKMTPIDDGWARTDRYVQIR